MSQMAVKKVEGVLVATTVATVIIAAKMLRYCRMTNKDATDIIYFTDDGSDPSSTNGTPLVPGQTYEYPSGYVPVAALKFWSTGTPRYNVAYA